MGRYLLHFPCKLHVSRGRADFSPGSQVSLESQRRLPCGRPFLQGAFLGHEVSLKVDMRRFYREAPPDYARWIRRHLFDML